MAGSTVRSLMKTSTTTTLARVAKLITEARSCSQQRTWENRRSSPLLLPAREFSCGSALWNASGRSSSLESEELLKKNLSKVLSPTTRQLSGEPEKAFTDDENLEVLDYPGAKTSFTHELKFIPESAAEPVPCYRLVNDFGQPLPWAHLPEMDVKLAREIYSHMVTLQTMDVIFYEAQRQGRFSFYMTTNGEEAINIATAAALSPQDVVFTQYREPGILMWRGFSLESFANQCFGNGDDLGKGRQMPVHYGSHEHKYFTISSPIATQLPQAVGAAYGLKMGNEDACAVAYFGDGASSEGDFHAAMNFASILETPILFICRNNGWAISTPTNDQFRSDGIVVKGRGYGIRSIRVDGMDTLALFSAVKEARKMAIEESRPVVIEALTYRVGHHSTSDDSSKYRNKVEIDHWKLVRDPVLRFKRWIEAQGWWDIDSEKKIRTEARAAVIAAMNKAGRKEKPHISVLFEDVYDSLPSHLKEQQAQLREVIARHPRDYPADVPTL
ncbi:hypothetical protein R1flu_022572 [Riccia fluitans]|uniref:3-methyl-2-oxobutanoate dehydrogenase (2-methylpropanoyl-transferring) n=1 Tax=Riccia fluitans TaxID=41844 RepID=A0ABD1XPK1_9MARC